MIALLVCYYVVAIVVSLFVAVYLEHDESVWRVLNLRNNPLPIWYAAFIVGNLWPIVGLVLFVRGLLFAFGRDYYDD